MYQSVFHRIGLASQSMCICVFVCVCVHTCVFVCVCVCVHVRVCLEALHIREEEDTMNLDEGRLLNSIWSTLKS